MKRLLLLILLLTGISVSAQIPKPLKNTYVNDYAHVLSESDITKLNKKIFELEKQKQTQLAIVLVNNIPSDYDIKTYARQIGKSWKVGIKERGIVYVAAINQRKQRLEVTSKLASTFTAAEKQEILTAIQPSFKSGNYSVGIAALINGINSQLTALEPAAAPREQPAAAQAAPAVERQQAADNNDGNFWVGLLTIAVLIGVVVWLVRRANRRRREQQQQYFNQNNPGNYNQNNPNNPNNPGGYGGQGYGGPGYGNYPPPYNQPPQNNTLRDMATGAIIGGALGYGARAVQDRMSDNNEHRDDNQHHVDNQNTDQNHLRPQDTPYRDGNDVSNEPSNWGNWGSGNDSDTGDYSDPNKFTDNSWGDSSSDGGWGDSGNSGGDDGGWSDSGSSDSGNDGGSSDW